MTRHQHGFDYDREEWSEDQDDTPIPYSETWPDDAKLRGIFPSEETLRDYLQGIDPRSPWLYISETTGGIEVWATESSGPSESDASTDAGDFTEGGPEWVGT